MRRVLIVSPHFPPVNAPDLQRVRQCLPHLADSGWVAEVLAVDPRDVAAPQDPLLCEALPGSVPVHLVRALPLRLCRLLGLGSLGPRARGALRRAGERLLRERRFDLVFFSTTQFIVLTLGAEWKRRFNVPYAVDWQDPWLTDYYERPGAPRPPGGWKYRFVRRQARLHEGPCLQAAAGLVSTSPDYLEQLARRYPWFGQKPSTVIPFGVEPADFDLAGRAAQPAFARRDGVRHIVYVGAVGPIMRPALELLFAGLNKLLADEPARRACLRLHFIGTSYAPEGQAAPSVEPLAAEHGVADLVEEQTGRAGHFTALKTMLSADALLLLGSADEGYAPSKIATLAFCGKPVLALIPGGGQLEQTLQRLGFARIARFAQVADAAAVASFLARPERPAANREDLEKLTAARRTRMLCAFFDRVIEPSTTTAAAP